MFITIPGLAPARSGAEPTALLTLIAGEFAPAIAARWPEPHAGFLTAPAARRHLACLALALDADAALDVVLEGRLRDAARRVSSAPGLERALGRLGETAWTGEAYRKLVELLSEPRAAKLLRHAETIEPAPVARLARLPAAMGQALHLSIQLTDDAASAVAECCAVIAFRFGAAAGDAAAARWSEAETEAALFELVREDLYPEPPEPPHPGTARLKPLATKAALRDAARRYGNCLAGRVAHAVAGYSAYYEWVEAPGAIVEVSRDAIFGWRLNEAKGPKNALVPRDVREELAAELALMGVYVGRSGWQLERALSADLGRTWRLPTVAEDLADVFGD